MPDMWAAWECVRCKKKLCLHGSGMGADGSGMGAAWERHGSGMGAAPPCGMGTRAGRAPQLLDLSVQPRDAFLHGVLDGALLLDRRRLEQLPRVNSDVSINQLFWTGLGGDAMALEIRVLGAADPSCH